MTYVHCMTEIVVIQGSGKILSFIIIAALASASSHHWLSKQVSNSHSLLYPILTFLLQQERPFAAVGRQSSQNFVVGGLSQYRAVVLLLRPSKLLPKSCYHSSTVISVEWLRALEYSYNTVPPRWLNQLCRKILGEVTGSHQAFRVL